MLRINTILKLMVIIIILISSLFCSKNRNLQKSYIGETIKLNDEISVGFEVNTSDIKKIRYLQKQNILKGIQLDPNENFNIENLETHVTFKNNKNILDNRKSYFEYSINIKADIKPQKSGELNLIVYLPELQHIAKSLGISFSFSQGDMGDGKALIKEYDVYSNIFYKFIQSSTFWILFIIIVIYALRHWTTDNSLKNDPEKNENIKLNVNNIVDCKHFLKKASLNYQNGEIEKAIILALEITRYVFGNIIICYKEDFETFELYNNILCDSLDLLMRCFRDCQFKQEAVDASYACFLSAKIFLLGSVLTTRYKERYENRVQELEAENIIRLNPGQSGSINKTIQSSTVSNFRQLIEIILNELKANQIYMQE